MSQPFSIAIHGGAGTILREQMSDELKTGITEALEKSVHSRIVLMFAKHCVVCSVIPPETNSPVFTSIGN